MDGGGRDRSAFGVKVSDVVVASVCSTYLRPKRTFMVAERSHGLRERLAVRCDEVMETR